MSLQYLLCTMSYQIPCKVARFFTNVLDLWKQHKRFHKTT